MESSIFSDFASAFAELACSDVNNRRELEERSKKQIIKVSGIKAAFSKKKENTTLFCYTVKKWLDTLIKSSKSRKDGILLLEQFIDAHLVHCPFNLTLRKISNENTKLQPTAKGIAILERWFYQQPADVVLKMNEVKAILGSQFNSMELVDLERTVGTGKLFISTGVVILLWNRMFGKHPQFYKGPERLQDEKLNTHIKPDLEKRFNPLTSSVTSSDSDETEYFPVSVPALDCDQVPYYNRSMVHPNSANLMHYFDNRGIRIFENLQFEKPGKSRFSSCEAFKASNIVSGHSLWQWIMDCTTVSNSREGIMLAEMMLDNGLLARINEPVVDSWAAVGHDEVIPTKNRFLGTNCLYRFTPRGRRMIWWGPKIIADADVDQLSLKADDQYSSFISRISMDCDVQDPISLLRMVMHMNSQKKRPRQESPELSMTHGFVLNGNSPRTPETPLPPYSSSTGDSEELPQPLLENLPEPPFPGHAWRWEYAYDVESVESTFENNVGMHLIMNEPALKLLFKEYLQEQHCRGTVEFVNYAEFFVGLIQQWKEARNTVTKREELTRMCNAFANQLDKLYISEGSPFEINITPKQRKNWKMAMNYMHKKHDFLQLVPVLSVMRAECWRVLEGNAMDFKRTKTLKKVPVFRKYVVAKTIPKAQPRAAGVY